jgi:hypothetical protein
MITASESCLKAVVITERSRDKALLIEGSGYELKNAGSCCGASPSSYSNHRRQGSTFVPDIRRATHWFASFESRQVATLATSSRMACLVLGCGRRHIRNRMFSSLVEGTSSPSIKRHGNSRWSSCRDGPGRDTSEPSLSRKTQTTSADCEELRCQGRSEQRALTQQTRGSSGKFLSGTRRGSASTSFVRANIDLPFRPSVVEPSILLTEDPAYPVHHVM